MAQPAIRDDAAEDGGEPHAADVVAVHGARVRVREAERLRHVQDEEAPHPVIAEALPHLREKECGQAAGMAEPAGVGHQSNSSFCSIATGVWGARSRSPTRCSHSSTSK